jgi:TPR repeat protein
MAQNNIGLMYYSGEGVAQDYAEARKWFTLSAEHGYSGAQHNLGVMYQTGQGVPRDDAEARKWFTLAAEQGHAGAQFNVGILYANGYGVPRDYVSAHMWFDLSAARGFEPALRAREETAGVLTPAQLTEARHRAKEWFSTH